MLFSGIFFDSNGDFRFTLFALLLLGVASWLAARQGEKRSAVLKTVDEEKNDDAVELCVGCGTPVSSNSDEVVELVMAAGNAAIDGVDIARVPVPFCPDCRMKMHRDKRRAIVMRILITLVGGLAVGVFVYVKQGSATGANAMVLKVASLTLIVAALSFVMVKPTYFRRMRAYHKVKLLERAGFRIRKVSRKARAADTQAILAKLKAGTLSADEAEKELLEGSGK